MTMYHIVARRTSEHRKEFHRYMVVASRKQLALKRFQESDAVGHDAVWLHAAGNVFHIDPDFFQLQPTITAVTSHYGYYEPLNEWGYEEWLDAKWGRAA